MATTPVPFQRVGAPRSRVVNGNFNFQFSGEANCEDADNFYYDTELKTLFVTGGVNSGGSGSGYVRGPASSTDNAIARFDGTGGSTLQNSPVTIDDTTGNLGLPSGQEMNWGAGNVALTHSAGALTLTGFLGIGATSNVPLTLSIGGSNLISAWVGATTGYQYFNAASTGANLQYGMDNSSGGGLATGSLAYSSSIGTGNATAFHVYTNGIVRTTISSSGLHGFGVIPSYKVDIATSAANDRGVNVSVTSTIGTNYGYRASVTGAASANYGMFLTVTGSSSNVGLRLFDIPADGNNWAIYSDAPAQSYFAGTLAIGGGSYIAKTLTAVATLDFGSILTATAADLTVSVTGAVVGDSVFLGVPDGAISGGTNCGAVSFFAWVSAADTVTVRCTNSLALAADPASGSYRVTILRF